MLANRGSRRTGPLGSGSRAPRVPLSQLLPADVDYGGAEFIQVFPSELKGAAPTNAGYLKQAVALAKQHVLRQNPNPLMIAVADVNDWKAKHAGLSTHEFEFYLNMSIKMADGKYIFPRFPVRVDQIKRFRNGELAKMLGITDDEKLFEAVLATTIVTCCGSMGYNCVTPQQATSSENIQRINAGGTAGYIKGGDAIKQLGAVGTIDLTESDVTIFGALAYTCIGYGSIYTQLAMDSPDNADMANFLNAALELFCDANGKPKMNVITAYVRGLVELGKSNVLPLSADELKAISGNAASHAVFFMYDPFIQALVSNGYDRLREIVQWKRIREIVMNTDDPENKKAAINAYAGKLKMFDKDPQMRAALAQILSGTTGPRFPAVAAPPRLALTGLGRPGPAAAGGGLI